MSNSLRLNTMGCAAPIRRQNGDVDLCLVTSRAGNWILPKGKLRPGESVVEAAAREAFEEAGIEGVTGKSMLLSYSMPKDDVDWQVDVYPLIVEHVADEWPEQHLRERCWLPLQNARSVVVPHLVPVLDALEEWENK